MLFVLPLSIFITLFYLQICNAVPVAEKAPHLIRSHAVTMAGSTKIHDQLIVDHEPIEENSYFYVERACIGDSRNIEPGSGFKDRRDYYHQAVKDATEIAHAAQKWPQLGIDASDLYFGLGAEDEFYSKDIVGMPPIDPIVVRYTDPEANIKAAAEWAHPRWGFDPYIILTCSDPAQSCAKKVEDKFIACYVNNTSDLFSTISRVSCCGPFFTVNTNDQVFNNYFKSDPNELHLDWMRTGGSYLLHEMMHTTKITQTRPHIGDLRSFTGKRVYGPKACANAALPAGRGGMGLNETTGNADSYASFALAMYWKDIFQGNAPPPAADDEQPPDGYPDLISEGDYQDVDFSSPDPTPTCTGTPSDRPSAAQPWVAGKIEAYCSQISTNQWVVNSTLGQYGPVGYAAGDAAPASDNDLWISVLYDPSCSQETGYQVNFQECKKFLSIVLNGCNTDSEDAKFGGQVSGNCALWNITIRAGHDQTPPNGSPPSILDFPNGK